MTFSESKSFRITTLIALITSVSLVVIGSSIIIDKKNKSLQVHQTVVASDVNPVSSVAVLGEQVDSTSTDYAVTAKEFKYDDYVEYKVTIENTSNKRVEFSPGLQFKMVDIDNSTLSNVIQPKNTVLMPGGPIEVGQKTTGSIFFENPIGSKGLRFYPDATNTDYVLVSVN
ncbi:DUF4352 domain-containing protein [Candidatus Saccharibacteria bacterium]|nr:DUF4352 domain-containing protein [Candidatus Saccharibacteria bacterium]